MTAKAGTKTRDEDRRCHRRPDAHRARASAGRPLAERRRHRRLDHVLLRARPGRAGAARHRTGGLRRRVAVPGRARRRGAHARLGRHRGRRTARRRQVRRGLHRHRRSRGRRDSAAGHDRHAPADPHADRRSHAEIQPRRAGDGNSARQRCDANRGRPSPRVCSRSRSRGPWPQLSAEAQDAAGNLSAVVNA